MTPVANLPGPMHHDRQTRLRRRGSPRRSGDARPTRRGRVSQLVGRRSELAELRRTLGSRPPDERRLLGAEINEAQRRVEQLVAARRRELEAAAEDRLLASDRTDITLPAVDLVRGTHHLITQSMAEICEIFRAIGYQVVTGPEVETVRYNFDALNHAPHHPARLPSDTLYLEPWDGRGMTRARTRCCSAPTPHPCRRGSWSASSHRSTLSCPAGPTDRTRGTPHTHRCSTRSRVWRWPRTSPSVISRGRWSISPGRCSGLE